MIQYRHMIKYRYKVSHTIISKFNQFSQTELLSQTSDRSPFFTWIRAMLSSQVLRSSGVLA